MFNSLPRLKRQRIIDLTDESQEDGNEIYEYIIDLSHSYSTLDLTTESTDDLEHEIVPIKIKCESGLQIDDGSANQGEDENADAKEDKVLLMRGHDVDARLNAIIKTEAIIQE
jgi:hypothetical protein